MKLHHSQKRIYKKNGIYFITTNTYNNHQYFDEDIFCCLFTSHLKLIQNTKNCLIYAYKINPNHIHLLIKTAGIFNYSQIMHFLKRNFSLNANKIIGFTQEGNIPLHKLNDTNIKKKAEDSIPPHDVFNKIILQLRDDFLEKYGKNHPFHPFKWQKSFHFHIVENRDDFFRHLGYIKKQHIKHELQENKYCFIDKKSIKELKFD